LLAFGKEEDSQNEIIGNNITNWECQIIWTYSEDVEEYYINRKNKK